METALGVFLSLTIYTYDYELFYITIDRFIDGYSVCSM